MRQLTKMQAAVLAMMQAGATVRGNPPPRSQWHIEPERFNQEWLISGRAPIQNHTLAGLQRRGLVRRTVRENQVIYELAKQDEHGTDD